VKPEDHARNLKTLGEALPALAEQAQAKALQGRAAIRATTFDRMPVAGSTQQPGVFILSGLGSRGFCTAPLLAEHLTALALDLPSPLPGALQDLMVTARLQKN
jgi:tRNA 5-methylaminomethyl-2-thiouridine biosynthesis bifunctional protein